MGRVAQGHLRDRLVMEGIKIIYVKVDFAVGAILDSQPPKVRVGALDLIGGTMNITM